MTLYLIGFGNNFAEQPATTPGRLVTRPVAHHPQTLNNIAGIESFGRN